MRQPTVLVTGGAGFIGSNFVRHLLRSSLNVQVVVFDKLTYAGNRDNLAPVWDHPRFTFIPGDICNTAAVRDAMCGCDWVVHFAAETHVDRSISDPDIFLQTNIEGTFALLQAAYKFGIKRFIHVSTVEVYGDTEISDSIGLLYREDDPLKPNSPYAASKVAADRLAFSYWSTFNLPVVITRCINTYGPYQYPEKQIPLFITNALKGRPLPIHGDGHNTRNWIHVDDHCTALLAILEAPEAKVVGEVFNIGTDEERSVLENARAILDLLGAPRNLISFVPDRKGSVRRLAVDTTKIRERLGWIPQIGFQEGLEQTVNWYRDQEGWLKKVLARGDTFLDNALTLGTSYSETSVLSGALLV